MNKEIHIEVFAGVKAYHENIEMELQAKAERYQKVFEMVGDRPLESLKKSELIEYARALEGQATDLCYAYRATSSSADMERGTGKLRRSKGADATNQANRVFWDEWKSRYCELRNGGYKIMEARRKVQKEIVDGGGKKYALDGALKQQLKE